jgi:hypothetical protein
MILFVFHLDYYTEKEIGSRNSNYFQFSEEFNDCFAFPPTPFLRPYIYTIKGLKKGAGGSVKFVYKEGLIGVWGSINVPEKLKQVNNKKKNYFNKERLFKGLLRKINILT